MPARAPATSKNAASTLASIGRRIRAHRKGLRVSAVTAAEAAGLSRVTWHRIEKGEPSVTMGAYLNALGSLGLSLDVIDPQARAGAAPRLPPAIRISDYPELKRLAWQRKGAGALAPREALNLYERNWRHVEQRSLEPRERELIQLLADAFSGGRLLV